jgi:hypothetical protein
MSIFTQNKNWNGAETSKMIFSREYLVLSSNMKFHVNLFSSFGRETWGQAD